MWKTERFILRFRGGGESSKIGRSKDFESPTRVISRGMKMNDDRSRLDDSINLAVFDELVLELVFRTSCKIPVTQLAVSLMNI